MSDKKNVDSKKKKNNFPPKKDTKRIKIKLKGKKIRKDVVSDKRKNIIKEKLTKKNIIYMFILLIDVILVIYMASRNCVNYVNVMGEEFFISKNRYLLVGRNYINLIIIAFFYFYTLAIKKFLFKEKITKKYLLWLLVFLIVLNMGLFFIFTKRIY